MVKTNNNYFEEIEIEEWPYLSLQSRQRYEELLYEPKDSLGTPPVWLRFLMALSKFKHKETKKEEVRICA